MNCQCKWCKNPDTQNWQWHACDRCRDGACPSRLGRNTGPCSQSALKHSQSAFDYLM